MGARLRIPAKVQDMRASKLWWVLLFCMLLVIVGASAAIAATLVPNSDPIARDNSYRVHKDSTLKRSAPAVLKNDSDPDGDRLSAARASSPRHGKLTLRSNGAFVYTPKEGYHGRDSFTYTARDGKGGTDTATVEITVWPVVKPVLARSDLFRATEDTTLNRQAPGVLRNDAQVDGRRLSAKKVSDPSHGSVDLDSDGSFVYTPKPDFNGEDSFVYRASDRTGRTDKGTVTITVGAVNDLPAFTGAASNTSQTIDEGTGLAALEASDVDGDALTYQLTGGSLPDGITLNNDGTFSGNAGGRSAGNYTANVEVSDGNGGSATTQLGITVNPVDVSPGADGLSADTDEDTPKTLTLSAKDTDSDNLTFSVSSPGHGTLGTVSTPSCSTTAGTATCMATVEYTPDADYYGPDSFTYKANDGNSDSSAAMVDITVKAVNDAPVANDDTKTAQENTPLVFPASDLLANDSKGPANESGQTLSVTEVKNAQHGAVSLDNSAQITFTPDADYNGPAGFEYTVRDDGQSNGVDDFKSDTSTVDVSVSPVNSKPTASASPPGLDIDEDAAAQTITLSGSDVEAGAANLLFTITEAPLHGVLKKDTTVLASGDTFTGSPTDVTYKPDADYNGSDPFNFKVTDRGDPDNCGAPGLACDAAKDSDTQTVPITVNPVNDAPSFDLGADQTVVNTAGAQTVSGFATNILAGPPNESGQNLTFTLTNSDNSLFSVQPDIDEATGDLTFTPDENASGTATVSVELKDDGGPVNGGQDTTTKTFKITVKPPNSPPTASSQSVNADEDTTKTITLAADDPDGDAVSSFAISDGPDHGTLGSIGSITCDGQTPNHCTADVSYTGNTDYNGADQFQFSASDAQATGQPATVDITVNSVNDAPVLANIESGALSYTENDAPKAITSALTLSDTDNANLNGAKVVISANYQSNQDKLAFTDQNGISGSWDAPTGTLTLSGSASLADYQAALRSVTYENTSENPSTAERTVSFTADDGEAQNHESNAQTRQISVTAVNDAPSLSGIEGTAVGYVESVDSPPSESQLTNALAVSDADSANLQGATVQITTGCQSGEDVLVFTNQNGISGTYAAGTCTLTLSGSASPANYQTALRSIKYRNTSDTPDTTTRTVTFKVDDGQAQNHESNAQTRDITVTASNDSPDTVADPFNGQNSALSGVTLAVSTSPTTPNVSVSGSVLANDTDPDTAHANLTASAGSSSANSGVVSMNSDGSFTYTPAPGFTGSDTFTYTVHDNDAGGDKTATGTVTINVVGPRVWFVNPGGASGNGTSLSPFSSLSPLTTGGASDSLDGAGDVIFVYQGTGNAASGGFVLESNQRLVGQPQGLSVTDSLSRNFNLVAAGGSNPTVTNSGGAGITLADGNTIQRVDVKNASGVGVTGSGVNTLTYGPNTTISGNGGGGLALSGAAGGQIDVGADITTSAGHSISIANRTSGTTSLSGAITDTGTGISLSSNTGATVNLTGTLNASTGANDAFTATGGGTVNVNTGATRALTTTTGTALTLNGVGGAISLTDLDKNGAGTGISLTGASASVTIPSGATIANTTAAGVTIDQGTGALSYAGTISNSSGRAVQVTNRNTGSPGLVQFTGSIASTGGAGVNLDNNDNGTITFSGGLGLSTGANTAFSATNGGTVNVDNTGVVNTLTTTTGTALNVANTTIGSTGLKFQSISSNGAPNGIVLNNTGSSSGLTVTGDGTNTSLGGNSSGGTISNATGADGGVAGSAIYLNNTSSVTLRRMTINGTNQNFGINGTGVTGLTLEYSTIGGSNGTSTANDEASVAFTNLTGSASLTNDAISGGVEDDVRISNSTGSLNSLSITGSTFATTGAATANDGLSLIGDTGASVFNATVTGNSFTRAQGDLFAYNLKTGTGTLNFSSNTVTNNFPTSLPAGGGDINISSGSLGSPSTSLTYTISNNNIYSAGTGGQPPNGSVIVAAATPAGSATGTISNNTIGTTGVTQSGGFDAILADAVKAGVHKVTITGNTIRRYKEAGIRLLGVSPTAAPGFNMRATVKGNVITEPDSVAFAGIDAEVGADPADIGTMCLDLGGTTAGDKNSVSNGDPGNFNDINLIQQFNTSMILPGYAGSATDDAAVGTFVAGRNNGDGTPTVSAIHDTTTADGNPAGSGFTGTGTNCS